MNTQPNGQMPSEIRPTRFRRHTGSNCCPTTAHISVHRQRATAVKPDKTHPHRIRNAAAKLRHETAQTPSQPCFSHRPPPDARPESRRQTRRRQPSDGICGKPCRLKPATSRVLLYNAEICACTHRVSIRFRAPGPPAGLKTLPAGARADFPIPGPPYRPRHAVSADTEFFPMPSENTRTASRQTDRHLCFPIRTNTCSTPSSACP